ncbi:MAG: J domain-containing protein [Actinomycetota bacterium]|nr:J domain-containing protein [Actinomycetota bacterium]
MIIAELEVYHSRPIAPTRRLALGMRNLPIDPAPGPGGVLLAGILADAAPNVQAELREDLVRLLDDLEHGRRPRQPRVRHRFQTDRVGLLRSTHRLVAVGNRLEFEFDADLGIPVQQALGALYAAGSLPLEARRPVFDALRFALVWGRDVDTRFISSVMGGRAADLVDLRAWNDPIAWALELLELEASANKRVVQRRFRDLLREAHPDHGGQTDGAAKRIAELTEARDILMAGR